MPAFRFLSICVFVALLLPTATSAQEVSFIKDVAPIINAKCGNCHVTGSRGKYHISTFKELMGSDSVEASDPDGSRFIEVIESGEMPKGGLKVDQKELETLRKWIAQGAKFDGEDEMASISTRGGSSRSGGRRGGSSGATGRSRGGAPGQGRAASGGRRPSRSQSGGQSGSRPSPFQTNKLLAFFDLNRDGQLSLSEIDAAKRLLYSLDANEDDRLTEDELKEFGPGK